jgi:hypothetical protein
MKDHFLPVRDIFEYARFQINIRANFQTAESHLSLQMANPIMWVATRWKRHKLVEVKRVEEFFPDYASAKVLIIYPFSRGGLSRGC